MALHVLSCESQAVKPTRICESADDDLAEFCDIRGALAYARQTIRHLASVGGFARIQAEDVESLKRAFARLTKDFGELVH